MSEVLAFHHPRAGKRCRVEIALFEGRKPR